MSHAQTEHSGMIFKCQQCSFRSNSVRTLQEHQVKHHSPDIPSGKMEEHDEKTKNSVGDELTDTLLSKTVPNVTAKSSNESVISVSQSIKPHDRSSGTKRKKSILNESQGRKNKKIKRTRSLDHSDTKVPDFIKKGFMKCRMKTVPKKGIEKRKHLNNEKSEIPADDVVECELKNEVVKGPLENPLVGESELNGEVIIKDYDVFPKYWKSEENEKFSCRVCQRPQKSFKALVLHEWKQHQGQIAFMCDICDKSFIQRRERLHHRLKHHGSEKRKPPSIIKKVESCLDSTPKVESKEKVDQPATFQGDNRIHRCGICGRFQKSQSALVEHQERYHKCQKAFICDLCGKSFVRRHDKILHKLKEHVVSLEEGHEEKAENDGFTCEICKENFTSIEFLENHYKTSHEQEPQSNQVEGLIEYPGMSRAGKFPLYKDM